MSAVESAELVTLDGHDLSARTPMALRYLRASWLAQYRGPTQDAYRYALDRFERWLDDRGVDLLDARREMVQVYVTHLIETGDDHGALAPSSANRRLAALSSFYEYALDEDVVDRNPVRKVKRPADNSTATLPVTLAELAAVLDAAEAEGPDSAVLALLMGLSGFRVSEAVGFDAGKVTEIDGAAVFQTRVKGGKVTRQRPPDRTVRAIERLVAETGRTWIADSTGARCSRSSAARTIARAGRVAGVAGLSPHRLRAAFASCLLARDAAPLAKVQRAMAHAAPSTTQRYADHVRWELDDGHPALVLAALVDGQREAGE